MSTDALTIVFAFLGLLSHCQSIVLRVAVPPATGSVEFADDESFQGQLQT